MEFEPKGNMGKLDLLKSHLIMKKGQHDSVTLNREEFEEVMEQLGKFSTVLSNLNLYKNSLKKDQYDALVMLMEELEPDYKDYGKEKIKD